jgi:hypothetical protein
MEVIAQDACFGISSLRCKLLDVEAQRVLGLVGMFKGLERYSVETPTLSSMNPFLMVFQISSPNFR